jgi:hypothetical protein
LKKAGPDGMSKVVNEFVSAHPEVSKRQTELKIFEVAVKEKRSSDVKQIWHIRPDFEHYLQMDGSSASGSSSSSKVKLSLYALFFCNNLLVVICYVNIIIIITVIR